MSKTEEILIKLFEGDRGVSAVYLFGSEASGTSNELSDVDAGILFHKDQEPSVDKLLDIEDNLTSRLKREIDLVVLNNASPIICMQVLKKGKKIVENNRKDANSFFVRTVNEYDDLKQVRKVIEKRIEKGRIYG